MAKDWSKLYKKYKGLWVALAEDDSTVLEKIRVSHLFERKLEEKISRREN